MRQHVDLTGPIAAVPMAEILLNVTVVAKRVWEDPDGRFRDSRCEQRADWEGGVATPLPVLSQNSSLSASPVFHFVRGGIRASQEL